MERTVIRQLPDLIGKKVRIQGWLQTLRDQKRMAFLVIRDTTGAVQAVHEKGRNPELDIQISRLCAETCVTVTGRVIANPVVKLGGFEIQVDTLEVEGISEPQLPLDPFAESLPSVDYRLDWRYLDLRRPSNLLLFKVESLVEMAIREFSFENRFIEIHTPKLMGSPSESGAELFELPYFGSKAYLAQSPQFYKQMAMAAGFERVLEIGPAFRADPSFTSRHMTEFTSVDMELSWIDSHDDIMEILERMIAYIYRRVEQAYGADILTHYGQKISVPSVPFPRMTMDQALQALSGLGYHPPAEKNGDIDPHGERLLGQYVLEKYGNDFVFLIDWPKSARPFYHMRFPDQPGLTKSFDLIAKGLEITTGAQREHRSELLKEQALEKGLHLEPLRYYLDFFRYGCPPHGGFGLGLSRFLMVLLGIQNIRETVFLFRGPTRLNP
jgi:nondiscriminating aspartyl-tRNA synthetase